MEINETPKIAAVVILESSKGGLLLLNRNYAPFGFCLVGGKIDILNESIVDGLVREVIDDSGNANGKIIHWYYGWNEDSWGADI